MTHLKHTPQFTWNEYYGNREKVLDYRYNYLMVTFLWKIDIGMKTMGIGKRYLIIDTTTLWLLFFERKISKDEIIGFPSSSTPIAEVGCYGKQPFSL
jgi:hypothetical protein